MGLDVEAYLGTISLRWSRETGRVTRHLVIRSVTGPGVNYRARVPRGQTSADHCVISCPSCPAKPYIRAKSTRSTSFAYSRGRPTHCLVRQSCHHGVVDYSCH